MQSDVLCFLIKAAEEAKRPGEMLIEADGDLDSDGRNLMSISYKTVIKEKLTSRKNLLSLEEKEEDEKKKMIIYNYRMKIEIELKAVYQEVIDEIENILLPKSTEAESKGYYLKTEGDYYRYIAEISSGDDKENYCSNSAKAYENAYNITIRELPPTNPLRLSIALNYSILQHDILKNSEAACEIAKTAYDDAVAELDESSNSNDTKSLMDLLSKYIEQWNNEYN